MKIMHKDIKKGIIKLKIQNLNDLWYLSHIIDIGDQVSSRTQRKIKSERDGDRNIKTYTKMVFLKIQAEKIEFHKYSDTLRVSGKIIEGPDDIARGSYHTLNLEPTVVITIEKNRWLKFQLDKLNESAKQKSARILICLLDREKAIFAQLRTYGFDIMSELKGTVQKKASPEKIKSSAFYHEIISKLKDYDSKHDYARMIVASPAFWKEYLSEQLKNDELSKKILTSTCSSVDEDGINEVLKRPEIITALKDDLVVKEMALVDELLSEIRKNNMAVYGLNETENAVNMGAVKTLLITDSLIRSLREDGSYEQIDRMLRKVDSMKGSITIISTEHDGGRKLDGLGGIGALLRYKL